MKRLHTKQLLYYSIFFFAFHFPLNYFIRDYADLSKSPVGAFIESVAFSLIMGLIFSYFGRPKYEKLDKNIQQKLSSQEEIKLERIAGIKDGLLIHPGKIYLTDQKLFLVKHKSFQTPDIKSMSRSQITSVRAFKTYNLFDNGVEITEASGKKHQFSIDNRDEVLNVF